TGVFFCSILTLIAAISMFFIPHTYYGADVWIVALGMISSMIFPAILVNIFKNNGPARVSNYILITVATGIVSLTLLGVAESLSSKGILWLFVWLPPVSMIMSDSGGLDEEMVLAATAAFNVIYFVIFNVMAIRYLLQ
ncbi:MAG: hypothetical protein ACK5TA_05310, partial [bacterium]